MKALKYLLIVAMISMASVMSAANAAAQNLATRPDIQMQSTSVMQGSGSALPQAASTGTYVTGSTPGSYICSKEINNRLYSSYYLNKEKN